MKHTHRIEIKSHEKHRDVHVRLWLKNGAVQNLTLKSNIYHHMKTCFRHAFAGKNGHITIHSENGVVLALSLDEIRKRYMQIIQVL